MKHTFIIIISNIQIEFHSPLATLTFSISWSGLKEEGSYQAPVNALSLL